MNKRKQIHKDQIKHTQLSLIIKLFQNHNKKKSNSCVTLRHVMAVTNQKQHYLTQKTLP